MAKNKLYISIIILAILTVGGILWWTFLSHHASLLLKPYPSFFAPEIPSGMALYTDAQYGFSLQYPQMLTPTTTFAQYYHLPTSWRALADPGSTGVGVVAIPVFRIDQGGVATGKPYPLYFDAEVRVGVGDDTTTCYNTDAGYTSQKVTDVVINGVAFKKFDFEGAGMMQYVQGESYRAIHNGKCFAVEQIETGSSYRDETMLPGIPDATLKGYYDQAGEIIQTFRFTK